jgi:dodecin
LAVVREASGTVLAAGTIRFIAKEIVMSIAKVIEITAESDKSFEDAIQQGILGATETLHNVRSAWVKEQQVLVRDNKIQSYRVDLKVTFVVDRT